MREKRGIEKVEKAGLFCAGRDPKFRQGSEDPNFAFRPPYPRPSGEDEDFDPDITGPGGYPHALARCQQAYMKVGGLVHTRSFL